MYSMSLFTHDGFHCYEHIHAVYACVWSMQYVCTGPHTLYTLIAWLQVVAIVCDNTINLLQP